MAAPQLATVRDRIAWSYANLACAHAALSAGRKKHVQTDWMIRAKLFRGLREGHMKLGSLYEDERLKLISLPICDYCGSDDKLTVDHLVPRAAGGTDDHHNLVRACRPCNSSKGRRDLLTWYASRGSFPPLLLLRRYLKLVAAYCEAAGILDYRLEDVTRVDLPFDLSSLPADFPPLEQLEL